MPRPVLGAGQMVGPQLALKSLAIEFLNVLPAVSESPYCIHCQMICMKKQTLKKKQKTITDHRDLSFFFFFK